MNMHKPVTVLLKHQCILGRPTPHPHHPGNGLYHTPCLHHRDVTPQTTTLGVESSESKLVVVLVKSELKEMIWINEC